MNDCEPALRWRVWATVLIIVGAGLITNAWKLQHLNPRYVELFGEEFKLVSQGLPHDPIDLRSVERYVPLLADSAISSGSARDLGRGGVRGRRGMKGQTASEKWAQLGADFNPIFAKYSAEHRMEARVLDAR